MEISELKNCPFCGGRPVEYGTIDTVWISCENCEISTDVYDIESNEHIKVWQRRVNDE